MTEPSPPPYVVGFGPNANHPPVGKGPAGAAELERNAKLWLAIALASSLLCGGGCLLGLTGAVMCFLAQKAAEQGHVADAEQKLRWGRILTVAGIAIGLLVILGFVLLRA